MFQEITAEQKPNAIYFSASYLRIIYNLWILFINAKRKAFLYEPTNLAFISSK